MWAKLFITSTVKLAMEVPLVQLGGWSQVKTTSGCWAKGGFRAAIWKGRTLEELPSGELRKEDICQEIFKTVKYYSKRPVPIQH